MGGVLVVTFIGQLMKVDLEEVSNGEVSNFRQWRVIRRRFFGGEGWRKADFSCFGPNFRREYGGWWKIEQILAVFGQNWGQDVEYERWIHYVRCCSCYYLRIIQEYYWHKSISIYNKGMTNNNNNTRKVNKMTNLDKLTQTFLSRGHDWLNAVRLAKNALSIMDNGHKVALRKWVRVDD